MDEQARKIREDFEIASEALRIATVRLRELERDCKHSWGETEPADIYHPAYHFPGDSPGTMGVDRQLPMDVPARTEKRWRRVCKKCGRIEHTLATKDHVTKEPIF
jgi:hypothetical protein